MTAADPVWAVYAIRYASAMRRAHGNFVDTSGIIDQAMPIDFYVWLLCRGDQAILVDTGFNGAAAIRRDRHLLCKPLEVIDALGLAPGGIDDVVLTHLHYDHAGNLDALPQARLHIQAREMAFAAGPAMCEADQRHFVEAEDVATAIHALHGGRAVLHEGDGAIAPGVSVHLIGGHTAGLQVVRVLTQRGWVVLASDASHYYANMMLGNPFPAIWDRAAMMAGYDRLRSLADGEDHIIPGHDPQVLALYPALQGGGGAVVCLHLPPGGPVLLEDLLARPGA